MKHSNSCELFCIIKFFHDRGLFVLLEKRQANFGKFQWLYKTDRYCILRAFPYEVGSRCI